MNNQLVEPVVLSGFRDVFGSDLKFRKSIITEAEKQCQLFGFEELDTPCIEKKEVLVGKSQVFNKSIFITKIMKGLEDDNVQFDSEFKMGLRFDLTVSLARFVSANPNLKKPFKRFQVGKVWRGEQAQRGRFREFVQFDFDIIGSRSVLADTEIILLADAILGSLGVINFLIKINNRKILNGLIERLGVEDVSANFLRIVDKFERIGFDQVLDELQAVPDNLFDQSKVNLSVDQISIVKDFLQLRELSSLDLIKALEVFFGDLSETGQQGVSELKSIVEYLDLSQLDSARYAIDLSVARGLDYYTGPVFETVLLDLPSLGSILSGGRFDGLTGRFNQDYLVPGVGASIGVDRLLVAVKELNLFQDQVRSPNILVTIFNEDLQDSSLKIVQLLRSRGIKAELYLGGNLNFKAQFHYALKNNYQYAIIIGPDESLKNQVSVKDLKTKSQLVFSQEACLNFFSKL